MGLPQCGQREGRRGSLRNGLRNGITNNTTITTRDWLVTGKEYPVCHLVGASDWLVFGTGSAPGDGVSTCNGYLWVFEDWLVIGKEYPVCHFVGLVIG